MAFMSFFTGRHLQLVGPRLPFDLLIVRVHLQSARLRLVGTNTISIQLFSSCSFHLKTMNIVVFLIRRSPTPLPSSSRQSAPVPPPVSHQQPVPPKRGVNTPGKTKRLAGRAAKKPAKKKLAYELTQEELDEVVASEVKEYLPRLRKR